MSENLEIKVGLTLDDGKIESQMKEAMNSIKTLVDNKANVIDIKVNVDKTGLTELAKIENAVKEINKLSKDAQASLFSTKGGTKASDGAVDSMKEQQRLHDERRKQEIMYSQMFDTLKKQENDKIQADLDAQKAMVEEGAKIANAKLKEQQKIEKAKLKEQQKINNERLKEEKRYAQMFDSLTIKDRNKAYKDQQQEEARRLKEKAKQEQEQIKEQEAMYAQLFKEVDKKEKELTAIKQKETREQESMYKKMFDSIEKEEQKQLIKSQKERTKSFDSIAKDMQKAQSQIGKLEKSGFVDIGELDKVKSALKEISDIHVWDNLDNLDLTQSRGEIDKVLDSLKQLDDVRLEGVKGAKLENFTSKITGNLDKLEAEFKKLGKSTDEIDKIRTELIALDSVPLDKLPSTLQNITQRVSGMSSELRQANNATRNLRGMSGFLGDISDSMRTFTLGNMIGDGIVTSIRSVTRSFMEMDSAITNVKKVAEQTDINSSMKLDGLKSQAIDIAKEVGMSSSDVINGIADSLQAGMGSMEQSIAVARSSLMLANVGDMAQAQASSAINTMVKGFNIDPLKEVTREMNGTVVKTNELTEAMDMLNHAG